MCCGCCDVNTLCVEWAVHTDAIVEEAQILNIRQLQQESEQDRATVNVFYIHLHVNSNTTPSSPRPHPTAWNEAYIMLVSCIDYALDMTCIQSVSQCFIVCGIL